jgi:HAD superfamily hydrolase (TIGR01509 family)
MNSEECILVLDAMGVLYQAGNDVADLLVPFVRKKGGSTDAVVIGEYYRAASLGELSSRAFWTSVGLSPSIEDEYPQEHALMSGTYDFLEAEGKRFAGVCCLSNDVGEWSLKLRRRFRLDHLIGRWFISSDIGLRKPDPRIYQWLIATLGAKAEHIIFVDDRPANVEAAAREHLTAIHFGDQSGTPSGNILTARSFDDLRTVISVLACR